MYKLMLLILVFLLTQASCDDDDAKHTDKPDSWGPYTDYGKYLFISTGVVIVAIVRHLVRHTFRLPVPYSIFVIFLGIGFGVTVIYTNVMNEFTKIAPQILIFYPSIYVPVLIFGIAFCTDMFSFLKALPQVLIISIPALVINAFFCGSLMRIVIDPNWRFIDGMLFGVLLCTIYPLDVLFLLKDSMSTQTRHIPVLLKGEMIIATAFTLYVYQMIELNIREWVVHWYQNVMGTVRFFCMGFPLGYLSGVFGSWLMRMAFNEPVTLLLLTISMCFLSYQTCEKVASAGTAGVLFTGIMMGMERAALPSDMERFITDVWKIILIMTNGVLYLLVGVNVPLTLQNDILPSEYLNVIVTYLLSSLGRFISLLLHFPILSRLGYGLSFQNLLICVWAGLKNPVSLCLAINLNKTFEDEPHKAQLFFMHIVVVFMMFLVINATSFPLILKGLGLSKLSITRQVNMNNCMKYINQVRERTIAILKMDRFLSDANWPLVTTATTLKHPYKKNASMKDLESDEDDDYFMGYRFATCPECKKSIAAEPSFKEMKEMTREARLRVLKLKKIAYYRQYENGMLSKQGVRTMHQTVELAMDIEEAEMDLKYLVKMFHKDGRLARCIKHQLMKITKREEDDVKIPRKALRFICYEIMMSTWFTLVIFFTVLLNIIYASYNLVYIPDELGSEYYLNIVFDIIFFLIYFVEFWIIILAHSWISICEHGFRSYFRSIWNILDFIVLSSSFIDILSDLAVTTSALLAPIRETYPFYIYLTIIYCMKFLRIIHVFKILTICHKPYGKVTSFLNRKIDKHRSMAYELAKNYVTGQEEILENLTYIVDNDKIREILRAENENDRVLFSSLLGQAQKEKPFIAVIVKTIIAIRMVLKSMKEEIKDLKVSGWVDDVEYRKLVKSLTDRYKQIETVYDITPTAPKDIFKHVVWMGDEEETAKFLYESIGTKKFDPGNIVFGDGDVAEGIYVLIGGVLKITYIPKQRILKRLSVSGTLPVVDYVSYSKFQETVVEYVVPGNTIGELSTLTSRPYDCEVTAETYSQAYLISKEALFKAMKKDSDPINGLECRLWKSICFPIALPIIMNTPAYRSYPLEKIKYIIERSFIPDISNYKVFVVNNMMEDVILIEGVVMDFSTRHFYTAPCHIPRTVQKIILPKSSLADIAYDMEIRLLIIPAKGFDEYEIMLDEEMICEMVTEKRMSKYLQHLIQQRALRGATPNMGKRQISKYSKHAKQYLTTDADDTKSIDRFQGVEGAAPMTLRKTSSISRVEAP